MSGPRFAHLTGRRMWGRCDHSGTRIEGNPAAVTLAPHLDGDDRPAFDATDYAAWQADKSSATPSTFSDQWIADRAAMLGWLVKRQTADTPRTVGLPARGLVAPGYRADLNVIDLDGLD